ncbi:aspartate aminotransferase family protein [Parahaliea mediterranea]|uniref:aspartate aminotransferase family protein n=1 Tax=Parahaliea mediterranea TaxID=651086 RepID=UPI000E2FCC8D|nr:aminotransferase class III-fold pyridoxal phosphate-dependent enzyme [Parahaliea mediterranea]
MNHPSTSNLLQRRYRVLGSHSPLFYEEPLQLVRGEDVWVYDADGKRYLDTYNNVPHVGHCHPHVVQAISQQAGTLNTHTRYLHENVVNYAERLLAKFAPSLSMAMFACTGSEANEVALRMARHATGKQGIIVTDFAYHGNTAAVAELGTGFMPEAQNSQRVVSFPIPDTYRTPDGLSGEALANHYLQAVQRAIDTLEARGLGVAGILICPDFANEGLVYEPDGFIARAVAQVRQAGGLYIADEVQGGFGRTGRYWWSHEWAGVTPDIVTLGKPMGNGHPISGVIASESLIESFGEWGLYFNTFAGNPVSCAAASAVLDVLENENLLQNAVETGAYIAAGLRELQSRHELIGDVRDKGLFFGVELVRDRDTKAAAETEARDLVNAMKQAGVLISSIGKQNQILKLRPPMSFRREHADLLLERLDACLHQVTEARRG